jgi:peptidyl-tRNA hydrolase, PTH1 family
VATELYDQNKIRAIIGLGNPGPKYYLTRHSIGFQIVDVLIDQVGGSWEKNDVMEYTQINLSGELYVPDSEKIYVIKPQTFMNSSGKVIPFLVKKGIKPEEILVVHDELEKPLGNVAIRFGGSARGHNGLKSIMNIIGKDFWHLRFGVDRPEDREEVSDYVLSAFTKDEEEELGIFVQKSVDLILGK